jgi:hypothetical protein
MFLAIMPWLMTLAPTNEAVRRENHKKKTLIRKKITVAIREVMKDVRIVRIEERFKRRCPSVSVGVRRCVP